MQQFARKHEVFKPAVSCSNALLTGKEWHMTHHPPDITNRTSHVCLRLMQLGNQDLSLLSKSFKHSDWSGLACHSVSELKAWDSPIMYSRKTSVCNNTVQ